MRILIAVAHADDEALGCFSQLLNDGDDVHILHATDSTPLDPRYALKNGYPDVDAYRAGRRREMLEALAVTGLDPARHWRALPFADQDAPNRIAEIRRAVAAYQADRIYTHAYEGGHPDHDALAFAVSGIQADQAAEVWEFPLYHASPEGELPTVNHFLDGEASTVVRLTPAQLDHKRRTLACFRSQKRVLDNFDTLDIEQFRPQKAYDFDAPPHAGPLYYEIRRHGWTWPAWRAAIQATA